MQQNSELALVQNTPSRVIAEARRELALANAPRQDPINKKIVPLPHALFKP